ncbi:MAG: hypothetical protein JNK04_04415 [Myxococcales bacterium]|nr:hypothetical protein [Myxococcales bacterium]
MGPHVFYADLSSSEADAVLIAATVAMTGLSNSIVFLDRPEMYVPSDRLVAWVHNLAGVGQNNQWIVATSDPRLAAAVEPSARIAVAAGDHHRLPPAPPSVRSS